MTSKQHASFWLSGGWAIIFSILILAMFNGWQTPTFGHYKDNGGIASMTTSQAYEIMIAAAIIHHLVNAYYNWTREAVDTLSLHELWWDVSTSALPAATALGCYLWGNGAEWWIHFRIVILGIVTLATIDDVMPTWRSLKEIKKRLL